MSIWYAEIESYIVSYLDYQLVQQDDAPYPSLFCTTTKKNSITEDETSVSGRLPTLYVHSELVEKGNDLENSSVNAVRSTVQLVVYAEDRATCSDIAYQTAEEMKKLAFDVPQFPAIVEYKNIYLASMICRRIISRTDSDIVPQQ